METCKRCSKAVKALQTVLKLDSTGLNAWRVECCATCKAAIQSANAQQRRRRERQYTRQKSYR